MSKNKLVFEKMNYLLMIGGVLILLLGLIIMMFDSEPYGFGAMGITIGPIIVFLGLIVEVFAIFYQSKKKE